LRASEVRLHAGVLVYWKEVRAEAYTKTRAEFLSSTGRTIIIAIIGFVLVSATLSIMHLTIPITVIVGVGAAIGANLVYLFGQWCSQLVAIPALKHKAQEQIIREKDKKIAELSPAVRPYSELQLTKLARLKQEGGVLLEQHVVPTLSQPALARQELQTLLENHRKWRKEISEILNEEDATIFEAPTVAKINFHMPGLPAPYSAEHSRMRHQLFNELARLEEILVRAHRSVA
jgi:hypothetical protein